MCRGHLSYPVLFWFGPSCAAAAPTLAIASLPFTNLSDRNLEKQKKKEETMFRRVRG